jgi:hypothetical protein
LSFLSEFIQMNEQGCLGIHIARDRAVAVCLDSAQASAESVRCFEVSVQQAESRSAITETADKIAQFCSQNNMQFSHVAVAVDCSLYMQHDVHSNFTDARQLESTVRFDTEEALATDISDVALAFSVLSTDENGSALRVFSAQKKILAEIINALAVNNLDPVTVEPDVACLSRFIAARYFNRSGQPENTLFAALSKTNGYLIGPFGAGPEDTPIQRTFVIASGQDRNDLICRQVPLSLAQLGTGAPKKLIVFDSAATLQADRVTSALGLAVETAVWHVPNDCTDPIAFAAAFGAAVSGTAKQTHLSFRTDYMPYLGKRRRLERTLKIVSISACVVVVALGLNLSLRLLQQNKPVRLLHKKLAADYAPAIPDKKMPATLAAAKEDLRKERNRIKSVRRGELSTTGEKSVPVKLVMVLEAFNAVAARTNLNIDKITITGKTITITGDTSNRSGTLQLLNQIKKTMNVQQTGLGTKGSRDTFTITAVLKTG